MSDRLNDLRRERAVIQAHLEWLDREIAAQNSPSGSPSSLNPTGALTPVLGKAMTPHDSTSQEIDDALAPYRQDPLALQADVKKGCLIYFGIGFIVLFMCLAGFYLYSRHLHAQRAPFSAPTVEQPRPR